MTEARAGSAVLQRTAHGNESEEDLVALPNKGDDGDVIEQPAICRRKGRLLLLPVVSLLFVALLCWFARFDICFYAPNVFSTEVDLVAAEGSGEIFCRCRWCRELESCGMDVIPFLIENAKSVGMEHSDYYLALVKHIYFAHSNQWPCYMDKEGRYHPLEEDLPKTLWKKWWSQEALHRAPSQGEPEPKTNTTPTNEPTVTPPHAQSIFKGNKGCY